MSQRERVECKHENLYPDYNAGGACANEYCEWWEDHCRDCGRFVVRCKCGFESGESGWPRSRWMKVYRRQEAKARERSAALLASKALEIRTPLGPCGEVS